MKQKGDKLVSTKAKSLGEKLTQWQTHFKFFEQNGNFRYPGFLERDQECDESARQARELLLPKGRSFK